VLTVFPNRPTGKLYPGYKRRLVQREKAPEGFELIRCFSFFSSKSRLISRFMENLSFGVIGGGAVLRVRCPDVIYSNTWPVLATGIVSAIARLRRIPLVVSIQDIYPESLIYMGRIKPERLLSRLMKWIDGVIARGCHSVIVISDVFAELYRRERGVNPARLRVISNWADSEAVTPNDKRAAAFRTEKNIPPDAFVILYGGNVGTAAGVENLINAFARLRDIEQLYLVIAGQGSRIDACQELARKLACPRIVFQQPWPKEQTSTVLAAADVLILPTSGLQSLTSFPSKLISYMLSARPIIATADSRSDLAAIIEKSECGWVVESDQPGPLAARIKEVMARDTSELIHRGEMGRSYALANLTREVCLPRVIDVLQAAGANHA